MPKKKVIILPVGSKIPQDKLKKMLKTNYTVVDNEQYWSHCADVNVPHQAFNLPVTGQERLMIGTDETNSSSHDPKTFTPTVQGQKKMKKLRTILFIPSFRKSKKSQESLSVKKSSEHNSVFPSAGVVSPDPVSDINDSVKLVVERCESDSARISDSDSGRDSDSVGGDSASVSSSTSSLGNPSQPFGSLDSGIDCVVSSHTACPMLPDKSLRIKTCVKEGRAPIASPEDDSLLEDIAEENVSDMKSDVSTRTIDSVGLHILSDSSSDSDSDSDSDDQHSACDSSDSDSDIAQSRQFRQSESSESDSDSDQCLDFFSSQCSLQSQNSFHISQEQNSSRVSEQNLSRISEQNSSRISEQNSSRISLKHVNKTLKSIVRKGMIKTNGLVKQQLNSSACSASRPLSSLDITAHNWKSSSFNQTHQVSKFFMDHERAVRPSNVTEAAVIPQQKKVNTSSSHQPSNAQSFASDSKSNRQFTGSRPTALHRSQSLQYTSSTKRDTRMKSPTLQVRSRSVNMETAMDQAHLDASVPEICADTSKSPAEVRQSLQKTAFWVENNGYNVEPDIGNQPLLQRSAEVSQQDLCKEIIGIYFGDDSDSSLSSSCLDTSIGEDSITSPDTPPDHSPLRPSTIETNIDDFSTATYIPAPYQTSQARTRKISSAEIVKSSTTAKENHQSIALSSKSTKSESGPKLCCEKKPVTYLSENEVDTITKLHTLCNGQRIVKYLNMSESPMMHYPPPKRASRISWHQTLAACDLDHHSPHHTPTKPKSVLRQRPKDFQFPFVEDRPSPIVITRLRRSKSLSRSREWPW